MVDLFFGCYLVTLAIFKLENDGSCQDTYH